MYLDVAVTKAPAFRRKSNLAAVADMLLMDMVAMVDVDTYNAALVFALDVVVLLDEDEGGKGYAQRLQHLKGHGCGCLMDQSTIIISSIQQGLQNRHL